MITDHDDYPDSHIREILDTVKSIAVVGASPNPARPSYLVVKYLISKGYQTFAVNPGQAGNEVAGAPCYASLAEVPKPLDMVDIFRNSEAAGNIVDEALAMTPLPSIIWMQLSVRNDEAAKRAEAVGVTVVMNRCPKIEYARLCGEIGWVGVNSGVISAKRPKLQSGYQRYKIKR